MDEPNTWAIVELMGHRRLAGRVTEVERFGAKFVRVEAPYGDRTVVGDYAPSALYGLTYCDEALVRRTNAREGVPYQLAGMLGAGDGIDVRPVVDCALCEGRPEGTTHARGCPNDHEDDPEDGDIPL